MHKGPVSINHLGWAGRISGGGGGGSLEIGLPKGGVYSLEDFVEGGGVQKIHTIQLNLQYLFLTLVNMILQKLDCISTKIQKL